MLRTLDIIIIVILIFSIAMFITGNGEQLMNLFSGNREHDTAPVRRFISARLFSVRAPSSLSSFPLFFLFST